MMRKKFQIIHSLINEKSQITDANSSSRCKSGSPVRCFTRRGSGTPQFEHSAFFSQMWKSGFLTCKVADRKARFVHFLSDFFR